MIRCALILILVSLSSSAFAFHEAESFKRSANSGGGAGSYYTGSARYKGYECSICHVDAEHRISIEIDSALGAGEYVPGLIYPITVRLIGEHRGLDSAFNPNTFTADFTSQAGEPVGLVESGAGLVLLEADRTVAVAEGFGEGETEWSFSWWSPAEGVPTILNIAMLDGDGASDPERRFIDPLHDDVATLRLELCPRGQECDAPQAAKPDVSPVGCSTSGTSRGAGWLNLLLLIFWRSRKALYLTR